MQQNTDGLIRYITRRAAMAVAEHASWQHLHDFYVGPIDPSRSAWRVPAADIWLYDRQRLLPWNTCTAPLVTLDRYDLECFAFFSPHAMRVRIFAALADQILYYGFGALASKWPAGDLAVAIYGAGSVAIAPPGAGSQLDR
jgi:hypothetical protein